MALYGSEVPLVPASDDTDSPSPASHSADSDIEKPATENLPQPVDTVTANSQGDQNPEPPSLPDNDQQQTIAATVGPQATGDVDADASGSSSESSSESDSDAGPPSPTSSHRKRSRSTSRHKKRHRRRRGSKDRSSGRKHGAKKHRHKHRHHHRSSRKHASEPNRSKRRHGSSSRSDRRRSREREHERRQKEKEIKQIEKQEELLDVDPQKALADRLARARKARGDGEPLLNTVTPPATATSAASPPVESTSSPEKPQITNPAVSLPEPPPPSMQPVSQGQTVKAVSPAAAPTSSSNKRHEPTSSSTKSDRRSSPKRRRSRSGGRDRKRSRDHKRKRSRKRSERRPSRGRRSRSESSSGGDDLDHRFRPRGDYEKRRRVNKGEWQRNMQRKNDELEEKVKREYGIEVPEYYKKGSINIEQFAEAEKKKKLLWAKKDTTPSTTVWHATSLPDSATDEKFKRLMGIHSTGGTAAAPATTAEASQLAQKQNELFTKLDQQYSVARLQTHTQRGSGLGFH